MTIKRLFLTTLAALTALLAPASTARLFTISNCHINHMIQDQVGYIWFATDNGLTRFDGISSRTFTRTGKPHSLQSNTVLTVFEDSAGGIWVGTVDGIQKFNRDDETFTSYELPSSQIPPIAFVTSIIEDRAGNIWFATSRSGVICLKAGSRKPVCYHPANSEMCSDKTVSLFEDRYGNIWVGSYDTGLTVINPHNGTMRTHRHDPGDPSSLSGNMVFCVTQTNDGQLLVGTADGGIDRYDYATNRFRRHVVPVSSGVFVLFNDSSANKVYIGMDGSGLFIYDPVTEKIEAADVNVREFDMKKAKVHDVIRDRHGNLWLAVYQKGALMLSDANVESFSYTPFNEARNIGTEPVLSILRDSAGDLWFGTDGDDVYRLHGGEAPRPASHYSSGNLGIVLALHQTATGDIYAGNHIDGLTRFDSMTQRFETVVPVDEADGRPVHITSVECMVEDDDHFLWLATNGNGLCRFNPSTSTVKIYANSANEITDKAPAGNSINSLLLDSRGYLWIGTGDAGLSRMHLGANKFEHFNVAGNSLSNNCINGILEDIQGQIWVATKAGLNCFKEEASKMRLDHTELPNTTVCALLADNSGDIWVSTPTELLHYDRSRNSFNARFDSSQSNCSEYKRGSFFKDTTGRLYFGGVGGAISFDPVINNEHPQEMSLSFTYLSVYNRDNSNSDGVSKVVDYPLGHSGEISLPYHQNSFTVGVSALEFENPAAVRYYTKLEGYDRNWIKVPQGSNEMLYTHVSPGKYVLKVRAEQDGHETVEKQLKITIVPPVYLSWWAVAIYAVFALLIIGVLITLFIKKQKEKAKHIRMAADQDILESRLQFFTDISHEIRTPLTLILGPVESLKSKNRDKASAKAFEVIERNCHRILRLIDQVIDLRKFDNNRMTLHAEEIEIRPFLEGICDSFSSLAQQRGMKLGISVADDVPERVLLDSDKIDKIIFNLLQNAFKFTSAQGTIDVEADMEAAERLRIRVRDTGRGIAPGKFDEIFDRFSRLDENRHLGGAGIGLHLSREMAKLHNGRLFVESSVLGEGTVMTLIIDVSQNIKKNGIVPVESDSADAFARGQAMGRPAMIDSSDSSMTGLGTKQFRILFVEDDDELRHYMAQTLSPVYTVEMASNADEGLEKAVRNKPDCIVTDLMMPGTDGLTFCRLIRQNPQLSDIPLIVLTARSAPEQRTEGVAAGADSYITKPFNVEHLLTQINALIHSRRRLKELYSGSAPRNEELVNMTSSQEKMLERFNNIIVEEIGNSELSVEYIAGKIGVSRSNLHRHLKMVTDKNPSDYIREIRLRHASELLRTKNISVSEAAWATGFSSLSHFSTSFKDFFGMSPSRYIMLNRKNGGADGGSESGGDPSADN